MALLKVVVLLCIDPCTKKKERLIYGDHNYGARRAPRLPEGNHWHLYRTYIS